MVSNFYYCSKFIPTARAFSLHCKILPFPSNGLNGAGCRVSHTNRPVKKQKGEPLKTGATS